MAIIYRMTTVDGRKDLDFGGPQIVVLGSGESIPAASGFNEGDEIKRHFDDGGGTFECGDVGGTKYWMGPEQVMPTFYDDDGTINTTRRNNIQYAPRASRKVYLISLDGHWQQRSATTGTNWFDLEIQLNLATITSFSTKDVAEDVWKRLNQAIGTVSDLSTMDDRADAIGTRAFVFYLFENGSQDMSWGIGLALREVLE